MLVVRRVNQPQTAAVDARPLVPDDPANHQMQPAARPIFNQPVLLTQESATESESELRRRWLEAFESQRSGSVHDFKTSSQRDEDVAEEASNGFIYPLDDGANRQPRQSHRFEWFDTQYQRENTGEVDLSTKLPRDSCASLGAFGYSEHLKSLKSVNLLRSRQRVGTVAKHNKRAGLYPNGPHLPSSCDSSRIKLNWLIQSTLFHSSEIERSIADKSLNWPAHAQNSSNYNNQNPKVLYMDQ